jgi:transposase
MNNHKNARLTFHGRLLLVRRVIEEGLRPIEVAQAAGVSVRTVYKWLKRYLAEGEAGLHNRSSKPHQSPLATAESIVEQAVELRRCRMTYRQIAQRVGLSAGTVGRLLQRAGLNRLSSLEPARPDNRYEHDAPGDLLHLDIKKLGRFRRRLCE